MSKQRQKCFIGYSHDAAWRDDVLGACDEVLPKFGLESWNAAAYFSTESLRDTVTQMIITAQCGIYDLSYWYKRTTNEWMMPRNVFIELGIAIALNRPYLLLQHAQSKQQSPPLPDCLESIKDQIISFTGKYTLKQALQAHLPQWNIRPEGHDWQSNFCYFGNRVCIYREKHPVHKWHQNKLLCLVSDGQDADRPDFRAVIEEVVNAYEAIELRYMDTLSLTSGYNFLFCTYCQAARSTPLALYRITPTTPAETFISIGMSIALEKHFSCSIPKLLLTSSLKDIPSLLSGYKVVVVSNSTDLKKQLQEYLPQAIQYTRQTPYKPKPLPFKEIKPSVIVVPNKPVVPAQPIVPAEPIEPPTPLKDVYITYMMNERPWAEWIAWQLEHEGYSVLLQEWDHRKIPTMQEEVTRGIREARCTIALLSPEYIQWTTRFDWSAVKPLVFLGVRRYNPEVSLQGLAVVNLVGMDEAQARNLLLRTVARHSDLQPHNRPLPRNQPVTVQKDLAVRVNIQPAFPGAKQRSREVFFCYAHEDEEYRSQLEKYLRPLQRQGLITTWQESNIHPGQEWVQEVNKHLASADIILLLISADFLASDYCYEASMRALERSRHGDARVVPIILRATDWSNTPFAQLQALPRNGRPISQWRNREEAYIEIVGELRRVIEQMRER